MLPPDLQRELLRLANRSHLTAEQVSDLVELGETVIQHHGVQFEPEDLFEMWEDSYAEF